MIYDLFKEISENWKKDAIINKDYLHEESIRIPQLHGKYYDYQNKITELKLRYKKDLDELTLKKFLYYSGKAEPKDYKDFTDKPFGPKLLRSDIPMYLNADEDLTRLKITLDYVQHVLDFVKDIIKQIHNRSFQIKNAIEFQRSDAGF